MGISVNVLHKKFSKTWEEQVIAIPRLFIVDFSRSNVVESGDKKPRGNKSDNLICTLYADANVNLKEESGQVTNCFVDCAKANNAFVIRELVSSVNRTLKKKTGSDETFYNDGHPKVDLFVFKSN